jgi:hypothetical protein
MSQENVELWRGSIEDFVACKTEADWEFLGGAATAPSMRTGFHL